MKKLNAIARASALLAACAVCVIPVAQAGTVTATDKFNVVIKIRGTCNVTVGKGTVASPAKTDINFLEHDPVETSDVTASSAGGASDAIKVNCSRGMPFWVELTPTSTNGTSGAGYMTALGSSGDTINYQLYKPAVTPAATYAGLPTFGAATYANGTEWGNVKATNALPLTGAGMGAAKTIGIPVYGKVLKGDLDKTPDTYADTVQVTVEW